MSELSYQRLRELLHYDPETGVFTWITSIKPQLVGKRAGCPRSCGNDYRVIKIESQRYLEHRLAWFYMTKEWPKELDHCDLDKGNNVWSNLRIANHSGNSANRTLRKDNTSGFKGISLDRRDGRWSAYVTFNQKRTVLGRFATKEEAAEVYKIKAFELFGEFARTQ